VSRKVIADTAAIVGFLSTTDQWHEAADTYFEELPKPLVTCEAVITESCFLMQDSRNGESQILKLIAAGILQIDFSLTNEAERIDLLMRKYRSVPMSLADACLVRMSEILDATVFTFDGDFRNYRRHGRQRIPLIGLDGVVK
jgi:predicted nucleic acid-binding protein